VVLLPIFLVPLHCSLCWTKRFWIIWNFINEFGNNFWKVNMYLLYHSSSILCVTKCFCIFGCKQNTMSQHDYFTKLLHVPFPPKEIFIQMNFGTTFLEFFYNYPNTWFFLII
jgi:hypothetical protein